MQHTGRVRSRAHRLALVTMVTTGALLAAACNAKPNDYDGDKKADVVYIGTDDVWHQVGSAAPLWTSQMNDVWVGGDYDNDGKWEPAALRGRDWVSSKLATPIHYDPPGLPTATPDWPTAPPAGGGAPSGGLSILPIGGDWSGDGGTDPAYYAVVDGTWWIPGRAPVQYGTPPRHGGGYDWDVPVPGDYDGDGKLDIAVFHPTDSTFHILQSKTGTERIVQVGTARGNIPVPADYDGDGKTDPAVSEPYGHVWWLTPGTTTPTFSFPDTSTGDTYPVPADYDGDGKVDPAYLELQSGVVEARVAGAASLLTTLPSEPRSFLPTLPAAVLLNVIRLTFFDKCMLRTPDVIHPANTLVCPPRPTPYDLDDDRKADVAWTSSDGTWHRLGDANPIFTGGAGDLVVPGDYDRLAAWEPATVSASPGGIVWRTPTLAIPYPFPTPATATYPTWAPTTGPQLIAVPGDYDGDHQTDPGYYVVATGQWWLEPATTPVTLGIPPSAGGGLDWDVPVPGDYDGTDRAQPAVYRPTDSTFRLKSGTVIAVGQPGDVPAPADYDGDGKTDAATFRPSTGQWFIAGQPTRTFAPTVSPGSAWIPAPADYDGDGSADLSLFDPATGQWVRQGVGVMATLAPSDNPIEIPQAIRANAVRLAAYGHCLSDPAWPTLYPTHCPPT